MAITSAWKRKQRITIDVSGLSLSGDVENYPICITEDTFSDKDEIFDHAQSNGEDIRFTSDAAGETEIPFEIVNWYSVVGSEEAEIWVKIPTVDHDASFNIYVWYDNAGASAYARDATYGSENVWTGVNYEAVHHSPFYYSNAFEQVGDEDDFTLTGDADRTSAQAYVGTYSLGIPYSSTTSSAIYDLPDQPNRLYLSFYFRANTLCAGRAYIVHNVPYAVVLEDGHLRYYDGSYNNFSTDLTFSADTWYHLEVFFDATENEYEVWLDGTSGGTVSALSFDKTDLDRIYFLGINNSGQDYWVDSVNVRYSKDSTSNENDMAPSGLGASRASGKLGNYSFYFNGTGDYYEGGSPSSLNITGNALFMQAWVRMDRAPDASNGQYNAILSKNSVYDTAGYGLHLYERAASSSFRWEAWTNSSGGNTNASHDVGSSVSQGTFYHLVGNHDESGTYVWLNGVKEDTYASTDDAGDTSSDPFRIGDDNGGSANWEGRIDEVRVGSSALTDDWIKLDYALQNSTIAYVTAHESYLNYTPRIIQVT